MWPSSARSLLAPNPNGLHMVAVETDCMAGHVRLELRNVAANYPFERSHRFAGIQPNSGDRDYSPLSCAAGTGAAHVPVGESATLVRDRGVGGLGGFFRVARVGSSAVGRALSVFGS